MMEAVLPSLKEFTWEVAEHPKTKGYFYIAINDSSVGALVYSARRLKEVDPDHPIAVVTDQVISGNDLELFDKIIKVPHQIDLDGFRELDAYPHQGLMGKGSLFLRVAL